jgi:hypothetical protein
VKGMTEKGTLHVADLVRSPNGNDWLLGEWTVQLSCDGGVLCNVCPKMNFNANHVAIIKDGIGTRTSCTWEIKNGKLRISNSGGPISDGEYTITFKENGDKTEVDIASTRNSECYKMNK